ncbi:TIGR02281 family clan AA aspartic protease [Octadecabacter sp. G9-8]|uniref:TIGR02281 family clan AA aspartic protease n=2 Tax=Octadecabacter dasysiphoniae TaxID=2909341 RepID=A0ABS9D0T0_9RHOB|nr:TIGR02281 family clan AA aspartic protease [Octadecabacter dasysiphoniae]
MDAGQIIALGFLILLGFSLLGSILHNGALRNALIWGLIFIGMFGVANNWDDISRDFTQQQTTFTDATIEVPKGRDNHFRMTLRINNVPVDFLVDTGASQVVLTQDDAARIGLDPDRLAYIGTAFTANGEVATAPVRLDKVQLGDITDTRIRASVNSGQMESSLLGMSYLSRFESIEIRQDLLILNR